MKNADANQLIWAWPRCSAWNWRYASDSSRNSWKMSRGSCEVKFKGRKSISKSWLKHAKPSVLSAQSFFKNKHENMIFSANEVGLWMWFKKTISIEVKCQKILIVLAFVHQPTSILAVNGNMEMCYCILFVVVCSPLSSLLSLNFHLLWSYSSVARREALTVKDEVSLLLLLPVLSAIIWDDNAAMLQECILYSLLKEAGCCWCS